MLNFCTEAPTPSPRPRRTVPDNFSSLTLIRRRPFYCLVAPSPPTSGDRRVLPRASFDRWPAAPRCLHPRQRRLHLGRVSLCTSHHRRQPTPLSWPPFGHLRCSGSSSCPRSSPQSRLVLSQSPGPRRRPLGH
jgi:hypothetical protein